MSLPNYAVKNSGIHGQGLFAARLLDAGETVVEYVGECINKVESARRQAKDGQVFIFSLDDDFDLDGNSPTNLARFANHGCEPNCAAIATDGRIWLRTLQRVNPGEELTFDYGFPISVFPGHPCRCGAKSCCGFIVNLADRSRVRRLLNRPGRSLLPVHATVRGEGYA